MSFQARLTALASRRAQLVWHLCVNLFLLLAACAMWLWVTWRAVYLIAMVPIAIMPFSYARQRLHTHCFNLLGPASLPLALFSLVGMIFDAIMAAQILTARSGSPLPVLHAPGISWIGALWYSTYGILVFGYVGLDTIRGLAQLAKRGRDWCRRRQFRHAQHAQHAQHDNPPSPERRQFIQQLGLVGAGAPFFFSLSSVKLTYDFQVEERDLSLPAWPTALDGLRVAHLSDIHVGGAMDRPKLLHVAALTNAAKPDIVLHTGDFLTHRTGDFDLPLYEALARIKAPYGQWACLGNHDLDAPQRLMRYLHQSGVATLRNRVVTLSVDGQPLELAGMDFLFQRSDRAGLYNRIISSWGPRQPVPRILLNHDPRAFAALPARCADLVLSGHTHGGHAGIQFDKDHALSIVGLLGIPDQGLYHRKDMQMFVTRCVGFYGYPMRLGIPPEISILTLRSPGSVSV